jgi:hypothetical protein
VFAGRQIRLDLPTQCDLYSDLAVRDASRARVFDAVVAARKAVPGEGKAEREAGVRQLRGVEALIGNMLDQKALLRTTIKEVIEQLLKRLD